LIDFIEEKIREALADPTAQFGAVTEAAGAVPLMMDRLQEDKTKQTQFILIFGLSWRDDWQDLARMEREEFVREANTLLPPAGELQTMRDIIRDS
jgi:hypothetical protein